MVVVERLGVAGARGRRILGSTICAARGRRVFSTISADGSSPSNARAPPSYTQLWKQAVASAVPMVGFGFMDNTIMIHAGEYLDTTVGVTFGLSTLTAAAMGQVRPLRAAARSRACRCAARGLTPRLGCARATPRGAVSALPPWPGDV